MIEKIIEAKCKRGCKKSKRINKKKTGLENTSLPGKLVDYKEKILNYQIIYIEGDSAGGSANKVVIEKPSYIL